jgi:hypothetical protein
MRDREKNASRNGASMTLEISSCCSTCPLDREQFRTDARYFMAHRDRLLSQVPGERLAFCGLVDTIAFGYAIDSWRING